jgi:hypothetical protein
MAAYPCTDMSRWPDHSSRTRIKFEVCSAACRLSGQSRCVTDSKPVPYVVHMHDVQTSTFFG